MACLRFWRRASRRLVLAPFLVSVLLHPLSLAAQVAGDPSGGSSGGARSFIPLFVVVAVVGVLIGVFAARAIEGMRRGAGNMDGRPVWPRDWPQDHQLFTGDPSPDKPGYLTISPRSAVGSGHAPMGRTYPRYRIFPDIYPFREWRRRVEWWSSKPVWIPYMKRFQHFGVLGATGKGKSTSYVYPQLAYGAFEKNSAYFVVDVKSPEFVRVFGNLYRRNGKPVIFFDPFSEETLGFEPLWRSTPEARDELAEVIMSYSLSPQPAQEAGNSEFFKDGAKRVLRAILDLATYWPRQQCNLPVIQQLIGAGGDAIVEALLAVGGLEPMPANGFGPKPPPKFNPERAAKFAVPTWEAVEAALPVLLSARTDKLRADSQHETRDPRVASALELLNRLGYGGVGIIREQRQRRIALAAGRLSQDEYDAAYRQMVATLREYLDARRADSERLLVSVGEFISMPDETRNSVISTITNKTSWFKDGALARAFSRDELRLEVLTEKPCLVLIGAPMSKLPYGSLFVTSMVANMMLSAVFERGQRMSTGDKSVSKHGIFFMLDEFVQLMIKKAPQILATFRGFRSGLTMIIQERAQLRQLYGEDMATMEANTVHKVLLQGSHEESAEFYSQKAVGMATVTKRSKSTGSGGDVSYSESTERVPLMSGAEVKNMEINGKMYPQLCLSVGADVPAFPMRKVGYYEDPDIRRILGMKRRLVREDSGGKKTWRFWEWREEWSTVMDETPFVVRAKALPAAERVARQKRDPSFRDQTYLRRVDPYTDILDVFLDEQAQHSDELFVPRVDLSLLGVEKANPVKTQAPAAPSQPSSAPGASAGQGSPAASADDLMAPVLPAYTADLRDLLTDDYDAALVAVLPLPVSGGSLVERVAADAPTSDEVLPSDEEDAAGADEEGD